MVERPVIRTETQDTTASHPPAEHDSTTTAGTSSTTGTQQQRMHSTADEAQEMAKSGLLLFVPGKVYLTMLSSFILIFGFAEIIAGSLVLHFSSGKFPGGWYHGCLMLIISLRGLYLYTSQSVRILLMMLVIGVIVGIVSCILQAEDYHFVKSLSSCASYAYPSTDLSCVTNGMNATMHFTCLNETIPSSLTVSNFTCNGNSNSFFDALQCEVNYLIRHNDFYQSLDNQCSCVKENSNECYSYSNIPTNCSDLLDLVPHYLRVSFGLSLLLTLLTILTIITSLIIIYQPTVFMKQEDIDMHQEEALRMIDNMVREATANAVVVSGPGVTNTDSVYILNPSEVMVVRPTATSMSANPVDVKEIQPNFAGSTTFNPAHSSTPMASSPIPVMERISNSARPAVGVLLQSPHTASASRTTSRAVTHDSNFAPNENEELTTFQDV
jgi:uncharacterized membrane protein (DUF106 family)